MSKPTTSSPARASKSTPRAKPSAADYQALAQFRYTLRQFLRFSEQAARAAGITPAQHQLLLAIKGAPGEEPPTLSEVAELLQLRLHSVSELVERAVANGLVDRDTDPGDHRRVRLRLTDTGDERLADLSTLHRDEVRRFRQTMTEILDSINT
ncbi:MAG TPA: MarR family winged helix-turn-helix transcriptional regulator [Acidimicrobiales bacterium]|jgi:DNA-binding MarR family transcriptional regulator|nr:MarR family winged helix-turn-helix transcriptional regulator [Acidimicrobiales bacterium]